MPKYSYACRACDHRFDVQQAFSDDALTTCPQCRGPLRKLFGAVGVVFKGSGFYRTDSRSSDDSSTSTSPAAKEPATAGSSAGSSSSSGSPSATGASSTAGSGSSSSSTGGSTGTS